MVICASHGGQEIISIRQEVQSENISLSYRKDIKKQSVYLSWSEKPPFIEIEREFLAYHSLVCIIVVESIFLYDLFFTKWLINSLKH